MTEFQPISGWVDKGQEMEETVEMKEMLVDMVVTCKKMRREKWRGVAFCKR